MAVVAGASFEWGGHDRRARQKSWRKLPACDWCCVLCESGKLEVYPTVECDFCRARDDIRDAEPKSTEKLPLRWSRPVQRTVVSTVNGPALDQGDRASDPNRAGFLNAASLWSCPRVGYLTPASASAWRIASWNGPLVTTTPRFCASSRPCVKSSGLPVTSVTLPPASSTTRTPPA
jgi:hypothetical protein